MFLGIICDTEARRIEVPEDKLLKLEVILTAAVTSRWISFVDFERLAGKCTSISVAVPPASLYTYHTYKHIAKFRHTRGRVKAAMIAVQKGRGLWDEFCTWREVRPYEWGIVVRCHTIRSSSQEPRMPHQSDGVESSGDLSSILMSSRQPQISQRNG